MTIKEKIRLYAGLIGGPVLIIAQIANLTENTLTTKQIVGAYLSLLVAVFVMLSIIPDIKKFWNTKRK